MLRKIGRDILILFGLAVLYASTSPSTITWLKIARDNTKWWGEFQLINGDLLSLSHLVLVKKFISPQKFDLKDRSGSGIPRKHVLHFLGDSYSDGLSLSHFDGISAFNFTSFYGGNPFHLDTSKSNILIIEIAERNFRATLKTKETIQALLYDSARNERTVVSTMPKKNDGVFGIELFPFLFNKKINRNIEFNLFTYNFVLPMFETKAAINYYVFGRASGSVVVSNARDYLFLKETVTDAGNTSSYVHIPEEELTNIVNNLNALYDYYHSSGFMKVYLSIIPNTSTIIQPEGYNNLIPRIQNDSRLKMKTIDMYSVLKKSPELFFQRGDTHWSNAGKQKYTDVVSDIIVNQ